MDLDDRQLMRHNMSLLAEHASLLYDQLTYKFPGKELFVQNLMVEWWKVTLMAATQPDFAALLRGISGEDAE